MSAFGVLVHVEKKSVARHKVAREVNIQPAGDGVEQGNIYKMFLQIYAAQYSTCNTLDQKYDEPPIVQAWCP